MKINDIKTVKQTPQNKNSPVTMSMHVLQTAIYIQQIAIQCRVLF